MTPCKQNLTQENKNVKIKICGLFREDDAVILNKTLPDFAGFIFTKSPRMIDFQTAQKLRQKLNKKIQTVGVFVDEKIEKIIELYKAEIIDIAQLHGTEDENYIKKLKNETGIKIIKTKKPDGTKVFTTSADWVLFDTPDKNLAGGTGKTFNWSLIPETNKPVFLAGGLNYTNIELAISRVNPYAIDVSSGAEVNGHKDFEKINKIIQLVRGYNKHE